MLNEYYYDDKKNHPEGGGTCDVCKVHVEPGDGYEADYDSSHEIAREALYKFFLKKQYPSGYEISMLEKKFKKDFEDEYEDIDDITMDIVRNAFGKNRYICPKCAGALITKAANNWIRENYPIKESCDEPKYFNY